MRCIVFFLMIRRPPRSTQSRSSAASDVYKRQYLFCMEEILPKEQYHYTKDEQIELYIHSVKAKQQCSKQLEEFQKCRQTIRGKYAEPKFCLDKAMRLINCFQDVRKDSEAICKDKYQKVFECGQQQFLSSDGKKERLCQGDLDEYLKC
eukprot:TRINITY_DN4468_c0_g1_i1.p1 TRINITY_DN4468_c0_g1~~TRINITY_DN4468_c0_g1_i1.p1  ORF type:complete len:149 (-),score=42.29 TRINITY_DN4468_c0_g1_i1:214-660(-)